MQVVYSGYTLFFGSPCDYKQSDRFFRYGQAQALIDGRQNGWMNLRLFESGHEAKVNYLKLCAQTRARYGKYLTYGRLLEPVEPLDPAPRFTGDVFGWNRKYRGSAPVAEGRLWQAEDGALAVFLANYGEEAVRFRFRVDPAEFGARGTAVERTETLAPASLQVVEFGC